MEKYVEYHANNQVSLSGLIDDGGRFGIWTKYDSMGNTIQQLEYENGVLSKRRLYVDGLLFAEEQMKDEKTKHGLSYFFYSDSTIESINNFVNGEQRGEQRFFYGSGQLKSRFNHTDSGFMDYEQYYENGSLMLEAADFDNGETSFYDSLGNIVINVILENGVIVDTLSFTSPTSPRLQE